MLWAASILDFFFFFALGAATIIHHILVGPFPLSVATSHLLLSKVAYHTKQFIRVVNLMVIIQTNPNKWLINCTTVCWLCSLAGLMAYGGPENVESLWFKKKAILVALCGPGPTKEPGPSWSNCDTSCLLINELDLDILNFLSWHVFVSFVLAFSQCNS